MGKIPKEIEKDLKKIIRQDANKIIKETVKVSRNAISNFYADYSPYKYHRVYGLKNPFYIKTKEIDNGYNITFTYASAYIHGHEHAYNGGYPSVIFYGPFLQGFHGGPVKEGDDWYWAMGHGGKPYLKAGTINYYDAPQMEPSPWEIISDFAKNIGGVIK